MTHRLNIEMTVQQNRLLARIIANLCQQCWRKFEILSVHNVSPEGDGSHITAHSLQLVLEKFGHPEDIFAVLCITAHTTNVSAQDPLFICVGCFVPRNSYCSGKSLDEALRVRVNVLNEFRRCRHRLV